MELNDILKKSNCEDRIPVFMEHEIDLETAFILEDDQLKELIPKIGPRLQFKKYIKNIVRSDQISVTFVDNYSTSRSGTLSPQDLGLQQEEPIPQLVPELPLEEPVPYKNSACLDGRAILREGQREGGLLTEGSRRKLSQLLIINLLEKNPAKTITTEEFYRLASDICETFVKESVVVYYSAYVASANGIAKKNASGKLYETYISRRRKLRASGTLPSTNRCSSKSSVSSDTNSTVSLPDEVEVDDKDWESDETFIWLKNNVDPWQTVEQKWTLTSDRRLKVISKGEGKIEDYFKNFPALKQPQGYTLLLQDFRVMYPGKEDHLFSTITLKKLDIIEYAKKKKLNTRDKLIKNKIDELLGLTHDDDPETSTNVALMLLPFIINISPARKQKHKPAWKPSRAEVCDGFIAQVATEGELTNHIITKRESMVKLGRTLQPFVVYVGESLVQIKTAYVVINDTVYSFKKLITATDCAFKIFQATGAYYPEESEDIWTAVQIGFYQIKTAFDRSTQAVNTLLADLELLK